MSCQANVVSDKVGLPQWHRVLAQYRERSARLLLRLLGRPDKLRLDSEKLLPKKGDMTNPVDAAHELHLAYTDRFSAKDVDGML